MLAKSRHLVYLGIYCSTFAASILSAASNLPQKDWRDFKEESNIVFSQELTDLAPDELSFVVEVPAHSASKNEFRTATGQLLNDRELCPRRVPGSNTFVSKFPHQYGFAAGRFNVDGDPMDVMVLGNDSLYAKMVQTAKINPRRIRVIGLIQMEECDDVPCIADTDWVQDYKVLGVDPEDSKYSNVSNIRQLSSAELSAISLFWSHYKGTKDIEGISYPKTRVTGFMTKLSTLAFLKDYQPFSKQERRSEIDSCREIYQDILQNKDQIMSQVEPQIRKDFVACIHRVFPHEFLAEPANSTFYYTYGAYQLLKVKLDDDSTPLFAAISQMAWLKQNQKTHYRFVTYDEPNPGTGQAIFEWVKTKSRNRGCSPDFPPQHYDQTGLISFTHKSDSLQY